ncbi:MAG: hypothetical protein OEY14_07625 [Myxococcales bacterium]|nr:hypothetical protein [Myxococcales bacterium]
MGGFPLLAYGTPRKLPRAQDLEGRVVVLDVAFAANVAGSSFEKVTLPFLEGLGERLAMWIDHHDHDRHPAYAADPRFVLRKKAEHGACPELVTPARVQWAGKVDTICTHVDFDGLCSAAKWIRGGEEPYPGADADARAIDTRMGKASELAVTIDRALRGRPRDEGLRGVIVRYLALGATDLGLFDPIARASRRFEAIERESMRLSSRYHIEGEVAVCDATRRGGPYDKTSLLLMGQERARLSVVHDETTVTIAARFDSGVDLVELLGLDGGMPTRVSVPAKRLAEVIEILHGRAESVPKEPR